MEKQKRNNSPEEKLRRYMLGELSEQDQERYECRLLSDDESFQEADAMADRVQDELAEEYLSGKLTSQQRRAFESRLLPCSGMGEKLLLHESLHALAVRMKRQNSWMERFGLLLLSFARPVPALATALIAVVLGGGGWSVYQVGRLQRQAASLSAVPAILTYVVSPGLERSSGATQQVAVAPDQTLVELRLDVGLDDYPTYQVALYDSRDEKRLEVYQLGATSAGDSVYVVFDLPTRNLPGDDYQATLSGVTVDRQVETIDRYYFRLIVH